jgi:hypothetical protein
MDVKLGGGARLGDERGQWAQWPGVDDSLVWPVGVAEVLELATCVEQGRLVPDQGPVEQFTAAGLHPAFQLERARIWLPRRRYLSDLQ